jgi:hypothetical protein
MNKLLKKSRQVFGALFFGLWQTDEFVVALDPFKPIGSGQ